jgi:hypothetical protein
MSNPLAGAIFSIFTLIGSWAVNVIKFLIPKAVTSAGYVTETAFSSYKSTLTKIVDAIQTAKLKAGASGTRVKPDLAAALDQIAQSMNDDEKQIVMEIKKALYWK